MKIGGIDEVGMGCLAGPVVACVCALPEGFVNPGINDSKKLTPKKRDALYDVLIKDTLWGIGEASVEEINQHNILRAAFLAMRRALDTFEDKYGSGNLTLVLVDGDKQIPGLWVPQKTVINGDATELNIGAASIIAKVTRDRQMLVLAETYPHYDFKSNKGYGTPRHYDGLKSHGATPIHRNYALKSLHNRLHPEDKIEKKPYVKVEAPKPTYTDEPRTTDEVIHDWFPVDLGESK